MFSDDFDSADDVKFRSSGINSKIPSSHNYAPDYFDSFTEDEGAFYQSDDLEAVEARIDADVVAKRRVEKLMKTAKEVLTDQQYKAFIYLTGSYDGNILGHNDEVRPLSQRECALRMKLSVATVNQHWQRACEILKQHDGDVYEA